MSISNPYNFAKLSFHYKSHFIGSLISKFLAKGWKDIYNYHMSNPNFLNRFLKKGLTKKEIDQNIKKIN